MARWSLIVSDNVDRSVRSYLGSIGAKKEELSTLVEEAVKRYIFEETVKTVQERNAEYSEEEIMNVIDESIKEVRAQNCS